VTVTVGRDGNVQLYNHTGAATHVLFDITGYHTNATGTEFSFLSAYPSDVPVRPETSTLNFYPGDIRSNLTVTQVSKDGKVRLYNNSGSADVVVDLIGHYVVPVSDGAVGQGGRFYPESRFRRFDSREDSPFDGSGALTGDSVLTLPSSQGWTDIWNATVTEPTQAGFVSAIPWSDTSLVTTPGTSSVNFVQNETVANAVYASSGPDYAIYNRQATRMP